MLKEKFDGANAQDENMRNETIEVFEGNVTFIPNSVPSTSVSVSFQQRLTHEGSLLGKPTISFSATLPDNSEVFLRVRNGDMEGLVKLLAEGAASLTDRDSKGRSLLNVRTSVIFKAGRGNIDCISTLVPTRHRISANSSSKRVLMWML